MDSTLTETLPNCQVEAEGELLSYASYCQKPLDQEAEVTLPTSLNNLMEAIPITTTEEVGNNKLTVFSQNKAIIRRLFHHLICLRIALISR